MIDINELTEVLKNKGIKIDDNQLNSIISEVDYYGNKQINYSDFLSATINIRVYMTEQKLQAIFKQFDTDNSGYITHENIFFAMQKLGQDMNQEQIANIIQQHDTEGDGKLSFEEFTAIFASEVTPTEKVMDSMLQ